MLGEDTASAGSGTARSLLAIEDGKSEQEGEEDGSAQEALMIEDALPASTSAEEASDVPSVVTGAAHEDTAVTSDGLPPSPHSPNNNGSEDISAAGKKPEEAHSGLDGDLSSPFGSFGANFSLPAGDGSNSSVLSIGESIDDSEATPLRKEAEAEAEASSAVDAPVATPKTKKAVTFSANLEDTAAATSITLDVDDRSAATAKSSSEGDLPPTSPAYSVDSATDASVDSTADGSIILSGAGTSERSSSSVVSGSEYTGTDDGSSRTSRSGSDSGSDSGSESDSDDESRSQSTSVSGSVSVSTSASASASASASQRSGAEASSLQAIDEASAIEGESVRSRLALSIPSSYDDATQVTDTVVDTAEEVSTEGGEGDTATEMTEQEVAVLAVQNSSHMKAEAVMPAKFKIGIPNPDEMRHDPAFWLAKSLGDMTAQEKRMYRITRLRLLRKEAELTKRVKLLKQVREEIIEDTVDFFAPQIERLQELVVRAQPYVDKMKPVVAAASAKMYQVATKCFAVLDEMSRGYRGSRMIDIAQFEQVLRSAGARVKALQGYSSSVKTMTTRVASAKQAPAAAKTAPAPRRKHPIEVLRTIADMIEEVEYRYIEDEVEVVLASLCSAVEDRGNRIVVSSILADMCSLIEQQGLAQEIADRLAQIVFSPSAEVGDTVSSSTVPVPAAPRAGGAAATEEAYSDYDFNAIVSKLKGEQRAAIKAAGLSKDADENAGEAAGSDDDGDGEGDEEEEEEEDLPDDADVESALASKNGEDEESSDHAGEEEEEEDNSLVKAGSETAEAEEEAEAVDGKEEEEEEVRSPDASHCLIELLTFT